MDDNSSYMRNKALEALKNLKLEMSMCGNPVRFSRLVTNFCDPTGDVSVILLSTAKEIGEHGLTVGEPDDVSRDVSNMRGLWIDRWPVDLGKFWKAVQARGYF